MTAPVHLHGLTRSQLGELLRSWSFAVSHAARLWRYLYREQGVEIAAMVELPVRLRERLLVETCVKTLPVSHVFAADEGQTQKYLLELADAEKIETVLMRPRGRATACVSSQAGCALGCVFCATGQAGFRRNLTVAEIVGQAVYVSRVLVSEQQRLRNLVVMGMGEPLLNYDAVLTALDILHDPGGLALAAKHITISTVGIVPGIIRLADERRPYSLAVSLHSAIQAARENILPVARAWPLSELLAACRYYTSQLDRRIFFEWTLIEGANDSLDEARALIAALQGIPAQVNLIPLNPTARYDGAATESAGVDRFYRTLREAGLAVSVRRRRGIEISAGCGQLAGAITNAAD